MCDALIPSGQNFGFYFFIFATDQLCCDRATCVVCHDRASMSRQYSVVPTLACSVKRGSLLHALVLAHCVVLSRHKAFWHWPHPVATQATVVTQGQRDSVTKGKTSVAIRVTQSLPQTLSRYRAKQSLS